MELPSRIKNSSVVLIYLLAFICPRMVPEQASGPYLSLPDKLDTNRIYVHKPV